MTKIDDRLQLQINTLSDAGIKPMTISRQLGLKYDTVKKNVAKRKLTGMLPPKDKLFKGKINDRYYNLKLTDKKGLNFAKTCC